MHKSLNLFRADAVAYRLRRQQTQSLLQHSSIIRPYIILVGSLLLLLILVLTKTQYKETESARGRVIPLEAEQKLVAQRSAVVASIPVTRGQHVEKGEIVAILSLSLFDGEGKRLATNELDILKSERDALITEKKLTTERFAQQQQNLEQQLQQNTLQYDTARSALSALQKQIDIGASQLQGMATLVDKRSIPKAQYEQQQLMHFGNVWQFHQAQQTLQEIEFRSQQLAFQLTALENESQLSEANLSASFSKLSLQLVQQRDAQQLSLVAQRAGTITTIAVTEGQAVEAGQPMIFLRSFDQPLIAEVFVTSRVLGKLAPGQDLMLRYDAFDYQIFGRYEARISEIETSPLDPREHLLPFADAAEPLFRVLVNPGQHYVEGEDIYALQSGLLLSADFVVAEMSLIEFIFKPLLSLRGKIS